MFGWFKRGDKADDKPRTIVRNPDGHDFTEEERDKAQIARLRNSIRREKIKYLKERLEQIRERQEEQILQMKVEDAERDIRQAADDFDDEDDEDDDEDETDGLFSQFLGQLAPLFMQSQNPTASPTAQPPAKLHLTDEELRAYKEKVPKMYLSKAKKMSDEELMNLVSQYKPEFLTQYDENTIQRALAILRE